MPSALPGAKKKGPTGGRVVGSGNAGPTGGRTVGSKQ